MNEQMDTPRGSEEAVVTRKLLDKIYSAKPSDPLSQEELDMIAIVEKQSTEEDHLIGLAMFGGCPVCHKTDGQINVHRSHWFLCTEHKLAWCTSANMFGGWRHESEAEWAQNTKLLETQYRILRDDEMWFPPMPHSDEEADAKKG